MARWSRLIAPVRVVVDTVHSCSTGTVGRRLGYRWSRWLPDRVTVVSHGVADAYQAAGMVNPGSLTVLPNGVDRELLHPDEAMRAKVRNALALDREFLWFAAGRLEPVKDYPALLAAFALLPQKARLVIAGAGPLQDELIQLAERLCIELRVAFLGFEPNVRRWLQAADGFVLSSRTEGLPMVLLEAAACGLPAVATDIPGTREVVEDDVTGFLAQAGDASALTEKMSALMLASREERRTMGEQAMQRVSERFSLDAVLDQWEALYGELLEHNPMPRRWGRSVPSGDSRIPRTEQELQTETQPSH
jgi:glycosyltransferase involved in cell wall biosynthesis